MPRQSHFLAFECWMEAVARGDDWSGPLRLTAKQLGVRATIAVWHDFALASSSVSASIAVSNDLALLCRDLSAARGFGALERDEPGLGRLTWTKALRGESPPGELAFFALSDERVDEDALFEAAATAASCMAVRAELNAVRATSALKTAAFGQLPFGAAIIDRRLGIVELNEACFALLARADGLRISGNRLSCRQQRDQAALLQALDRIPAGDTGADLVKIHRAHGALPYIIRLVASRREARACDRVLMMIIDPDEVASPALDIWRAMFDLTECELIIAEGLVAGRRVNEIASQRGVSVETVRSQTKRMFERLNVTSQTQAALLLSRVTPFKSKVRDAPPAITARGTIRDRHHSDDTAFRSPLRAHHTSDCAVLDP